MWRAPNAKGVNASSEVEIKGGSPALKQFGARIKRLGSLAVQTFRDTVTENGLPDEASYGVSRDQQRDISVAAHHVIDAVGPIVAYQQAADKAKLVASIMRLDCDDAAAESINSLARFSHGLDEQQRSDLGQNAIALFRRGGPLNYHERIEAAEALAHLEKHGHLTIDHRKAIDEAVARRRALGRLLDDKRQALAEQGDHTSTVASNVSDRRADGRDRSLDERIGDLEKQRKTASEAGIYSEHGRLDVRQSIAEEIPKLSRTRRTGRFHATRKGKIAWRTLITQTLKGNNLVVFLLAANARFEKMIGGFAQILELLLFLDLLNASLNFRVEPK